jgi:hypothetical protein
LLNRAECFRFLISFVTLNLLKTGFTLKKFV